MPRSDSDSLDDWDEDEPDPDGWAEDEFDYQQYVREHHGDSAAASSQRAIWKATAGLILLVMVLSLLAGWWR